MWEEKTKYASRPTNRSALPTSAALPQLPYYEVVLLSMSIWILITEMESAELCQTVRAKTGTWEVRSSVVYK
jgi:hypothetical protein